MAPRRIATALQFMPARNRLIPQPLGVVGIIAPWNYPLQLTLAPAIGALAAGNRVMIKPSELTPRFAALLREIIAAKFDATEMIVTGIEDEIAKAFAALPFDHLVFTGSTRVGRLVAEAAGRNLTPVTLELGGKSPAIVDRSADLDEAAAAHRLCQAAQCRPDLHRAGLRAGAGGARCRSSPDKVQGHMRRMFGTDPANKDYTSIISDRHYARLEEPAGGCRREGRADHAAARSPTIPPGKRSANSRRPSWSARRPTWRSCRRRFSGRCCR